MVGSDHTRKPDRIDPLVRSTLHTMLLGCCFLETVWELFWRGTMSSREKAILVSYEKVVLKAMRPKKSTRFFRRLKLESSSLKSSIRARLRVVRTSKFVAKRAPETALSPFLRSFLRDRWSKEEISLSNSTQPRLKRSLSSKTSLWRMLKRA